MAVSRTRHKTPTARESMRRAFQGGMANRVSNRSLRRRAMFSIRKGAEVFQAFMAVLAQKGGEVVVTKGTLDQVSENLSTLGYTITPNETHTEFTFRMTEGTVVAPETHGTVEITHIPDDEEPPSVAI